ncbi:hypothetical protein QLS81_07645 [Flavobacterium sp. XS2P67]|nr:hypothetical protein [Flavobacterium yafengii]
MNYCIQEKGLSVHAYVYMTSHIHLIVTAFDDEVKKPLSSYQEQKKTTAEYNRLSVQNYNAKYNQ